MFQFGHAHWTLLLLAALWSLSLANRPWSSLGRSKPKEELDPNVRDWGDYSDLPSGTDQGPEQEQTRRDSNRGVKEASSSLAPELDFLAEFEGKSDKLSSCCVSVCPFTYSTNNITLPSR